MYEGTALVDQGLLVEVSHDEGGDPRVVENQGACRGGAAHDRGGGPVLSAGEPSCCPDGSETISCIIRNADTHN